MRLLITPVGKPRQTRSDKWRQPARPAVQRYRDYADELRSIHSQPLPQELDLVFYIPMPQSWSKKKRAEYNYQPHHQKPDIDNLVKAFMDALAPEDQAVWKLRVEKRWGVLGAIDVN